MGNKNDPNDPFYKAQTGWAWEPQMGMWIQTGGPNAGGPAPAPAPNPGPTGDARIGAQEAQVAAANRGATKETPLGTISTPNKNPFTGGDLFAPDTFVAKGRDINAGAFGPTQQMAALKAMMQQGATSDATNASFDTAGAERARGSQDALLQQLLDQAAGRGPSPAQMMLQQAADRNLSDAAALTNTQRGLGATAASSQVAGQRAQIGQETARDAGILRLQEQMQAVQAAGGLASNMRGQDVGQAQAQAQVQLAKDNLNASMRQKYIDMGYSAEQADRMAMMDLEKMQTAQALTLTGMHQEQFDRGEKQRRDDFGTFLKSMGGVGQFLLTMFGGAGAKAPAAK